MHGSILTDCLLVIQHSWMMGGRTLAGNSAYLEAPRGQPQLSDVTWRKWKTVCQLAQLCIWVPMGVYFYRHDYHQHPDYPAGRPDMLKRMDGCAIVILAAVNLIRAFLWSIQANHLFWIVRDKQASRLNGDDNQMETTEPYGKAEAVRFFPLCSVIFNRKCLFSVHLTKK